MKSFYKASLLALALFGLTASAQSLKFDEDAQKAPHIMASKDVVEVNYNAGFSTVAVMANFDGYEVVKNTEDADWVSFRKEANGNITFFTTYNMETTASRSASFTLRNADGTASCDITVVQAPNNAAEDIGDVLLPIASATASSTNSSSEDITKSYDGNVSTLWHSSYSGCTFPVTLTYTLKEASHVDYMVYTPRTSGVNGNFGEVKVYYATSAAPATWVLVKEADFGKSNTPSTLSFGENGINDVLKVKIEVYSAGSDKSANFASCAEMGFYSIDAALLDAMNNIFTSKLCNELKPGVDAAAVAAMTQPYLKVLATKLLEGNYSTRYRVGSFDCYRNRTLLQSELCTSNAYDLYENPTGIYVDKDEQLVVFADKIDPNYPVDLCIANFSNKADIEAEGQAVSYYSLKNGINVFKANNRGNIYVSYYSNNETAAPQVDLHFAMARENGYFKQGRDNNEEWKRILDNAVSDNIDILSNRLHVVAPVQQLRLGKVTNAEKLVLIYDSLIYREREIMGLPQRNLEPKNHQFARPVKSGMFADGYGAAAYFDAWVGWTSHEDFEFWGMAHELGHNNQITPGFKWHGCGETTNNIYASWVEHKLKSKKAYGNGYHRLEDEVTGIDDYSGMRGGRFQVYLEEGVRKGISWQLQDGCDYHGTTPNNKTVNDEDENGKTLGSVTTKTRNYDHFVKVVPFWQLSLWTEECEKAPGAWGNLIHSYRTNFNANTFNTAGKQQIEMMKRFMDGCGIDLCDFFEKAGLLRPIHAYIEDYSPGWNVITQAMCDELKSYIASKGYPKAPAALNYINAYNCENFRNEVHLAEGTVGNGCTLQSNKVKVDNEAWPGAVGYETYNAAGELIRITMFGLGDSQISSKYTYVLFPSDASYIMAVGYDGTKVKIYQK